MFKRKLTFLAAAVGSIASLFAIDAHAATTTITAGMQHADVIGAASTAAAGALGVGQIAATGGNHAITSKKFRVAVEGATTDGRKIERAWIQQMAAQYSAELYGARVNCEHIRGMAPMTDNANSSPFGSYGDVIGLSAEEIADGPLKGKLGLYAQVAPTQALINLAKARQKVYTSIEINPSFADTEQAYLIGLAITDSPASLGTEMLSFAATQGDNNPLAHRKQSPGNLFTASEETTLEFEATTQTPIGAGVALFKRVGELLGITKEKGAADEKRFGDITQAVEMLATFSREQATRADTFAERLTKLETELDAERKAHTATAQALEKLTTKLSTEPGGTTRPTATGTSEGHKTDC
ncbi:GPO family capsid scaffolding protein [Paraburkholderia guartelaensis]|uniref:GPO family capsid scaffolding protein n=2 Tax=Paraburkholderia guartelaensis TaxID=2546446 RepID=A0A4R5L627_9BURK|nr:GPO family capsid scaffolding protein [Paraburkholderia guartelaensis]TDG03721.1 GPO family capsid scaffolding protein [Paraburkholderia guartelaensis]